MYIVGIEVNSKHIVLILKAKCMDKCGQATGYDHTDLGDFVCDIPLPLPRLGSWNVCFVFILSMELVGLSLASDRSMNDEW